jgi:carbamoyl-phosphate synthase large subunit
MKILIGGAGGTPSENVISSLKETHDHYYVVGVGSEPTDLILSNADIKYQIPYSTQNEHKNALLHVMYKENPILAHFQNDYEILQVSSFRNEIISAGVKLYMPSHNTILNCVDKWRSTEIWAKAGLTVPKTIRINDEFDLKRAFKCLGDKGSGTIWLRAATGGGGRGALPTDNYDFAKLWLDRFKGWGHFTAAELLTADSVTWSSIWYMGELVVAQARKRLGWTYGRLNLSGVTGITRVGETLSSPDVDRIAQDAIMAIDQCPHGIFSVDMTYDFNGRPNPTEINVSRFFTTIYFFTKAGLNLPKIYLDIALKNVFPSLDKKINPLPDGLLWIRSMDRQPLLLNSKDFIEKNINFEAMDLINL